MSVVMRGSIVASVLVGVVIGVACGGSEGDGAGARTVSAEPEAKVHRGASAKPEDEPRAAAKAFDAEGDDDEGPPKKAFDAEGDDDEGPPKKAFDAEGDDDEGPPKKGLAARVHEIVQAADPPDPVLPAGEGVAIPAMIPPGEVLIEHGCRHRAEPFGTTYWRTKTTVDLAKRTIVSSRVEGDKAKGYGFFRRKKKEKRTEHQTTLTPADIARIRAALDRVLAGGPYAPVHAVPEGSVCTLALRVGEDRPFFEIDKSRVEREDSVTRLIDALGGTTPP
jgi:hypothetical protein